MLHLIRGAMLALFVLISACTTSNKLTLAPTEPVTAYNQEQAKKATIDFKSTSDANGSEISLEELPLLSDSSTLKNYRPNRAYAVGYPYECGGSWNTWDYDSSTQAAAAALSGCLQYIKNREKHVGKQCGARLILINKKLLIKPEELPTKYYVPYVMEMISQDETKTLYGMFSYMGDGENLPLELFDEKGIQLCHGNYSLSKMQAVFGAGTFEMKCFDEKVDAQGEISIKRMRLRSSSIPIRIGIGKGNASDGSVYNFLTNMTIDDYQKYKYLLQ